MSSTANSPGLPRWFVVEIWSEIRERFKAIAGDAFLFLTVLAILEIVDLVLAQMHYPADLKHVLEVTHFWGSYAVLIILVVNLITKILLSVWRPK